MKSFKEYYLLEKTINAKQMGSLSPADEEHMRIGKELAEKYGLKFNGWWEISYTFTDMESGHTFLAKDEVELIEKLKKYRPNESRLVEMPHISTDEFHFDFRMEKPYWPERLVKIVHTVGSNNLDELLSPFYGLYKQMFVKKFSQLPEEKQQMLRRKLPRQFIIDMGV